MKSSNCKSQKKTAKWWLIILSVLAIVAIVLVCLVGKKNFDPSTVSVFFSFTEEIEDYTVTDESSAVSVIDNFSERIGLADAEKELELSFENSAVNQTYYRFSQYYNGIPVYGRGLTLSANDDSKATALAGNTVPIQIESTSAQISENAAKDIAAKYIADTFNCAEADIDINDCYLCIYNLDSGADRLSWCINALVTSETAFACETIMVNATDGSIIFSESNLNFDSELFNLKGQTEMQYDVPVTVYGNTYYLADESRNISVYKPISSQNKYNYYFDNNHRVMIDGAISEDNNTLDSSDESGVDAMKNVSSSYDYFYKRFGRKSFDNNSSPIMVYVHTAGYEDDGANKSLYNNAFSVNFTELTYGFVTALSFPDKSILDDSCFANLLDVVAHEYTHSVTNSIAFTASIDDCSQTAALQEAYSDIFGELVEQYITGHTDWVHHASGDKPRYLCSPSSGNYTKFTTNFPNPFSTVKYPTNMREFATKADGHISSTVISHCAYHMSSDCSYGVGEGLNYKELGDLWFGSLFYMQADADFAQCRNALEIAAKNMAAAGALTSSQMERIYWALGETGIEPLSDTSAVTLVQKDFTLYVLDNDGAPIDTYIYSASQEGEIQIGKHARSTAQMIHLDEGIYTLRITAEGIDSSGNNTTDTVTKYIKIVDTSADSIDDSLEINVDLWKAKSKNTASETSDGYKKVELDLSGQNLTDISFLSGRTNITHLDISHNQISDISVIAELKKLRSLKIAGNNIIDLSPLTSLNKLTELDISHNPISDLSPVSKINTLTRLWSNGIATTDITPVSSLNKLELLALSIYGKTDHSTYCTGYDVNGKEYIYYSYVNESLCDISALSNLVNLKHLYLVSNNISDISALSNLVNLEYLYLNNNDISDISVLSNFVNLEILYMEFNNISDISALSNLVNLESLGLYGNNIPDEDIQYLRNALPNCDIQ